MPLGGVFTSKPRIYAERIASTWGDPARVVMVGDRGEDVSGARANGVGAIGVAWGLGSRDELRDADYVMNTPAEIVAWARKA